MTTHTGLLTAVPPPRGAPHAPASTGKRIVFISGFRIFPVNTGGHVRTASIARALARMGHDVLIYSLAGRQSDYGVARLRGPSYEIEPIEARLREETHLGLAYGVLQTLARRLDYPRVWQHGLLARGFIPRRLKAALDTADIILCDMPWVPPIPGRWSGKPWFLVSHNLEHRLLEQAAGRHHDFAGWMRDIERQAPQRYRDIFTCAEEDQAFFRTHGADSERRLPLIRCGVDASAYLVPEGTRERVRAELGFAPDDHVLLFSGSGFAPNVEALAGLREFCRERSDVLARERIRLLVLGSVLAQPLREGPLVATGRVPEVAPYFAASDAGLNPIVRGSGANVKLFEYLAARLPVISTAFGVRGTALQPERDFLLYEPAALQEALERFVRSRSREAWRAHAEGVWSRHRETCEIGELVRAAVAQRPEFSAA